MIDDYDYRPYYDELNYDDDIDYNDNVDYKDEYDLISEELDIDSQSYSNSNEGGWFY